MTSHHPGDALHRLLHAYKRALRQACRAQGIDLPPLQIRIMKMLCRAPGSTAHAVGQRFYRDKAQITRLIRELEEAGLVERRRDPDDGRRQLLTPTAQGKKLHTRIQRADRLAGERMARGLSGDEIAQFVAWADVMIANLDSEETPT